MLTAHFHDVTYDHVWSKILAAGAQHEIQSNLEQSSNTEEQAVSIYQTKHEYCTSIIIIKHLSHFDDLLTAELRDSAYLIKGLNMSKTTQAFTSSTEV